LVRRAPQTLRGRLALTYACVVVAVMALLGVYLGAAAREIYLDRLSDQLQGEARLVGEVVGPLLPGGSERETLQATVDRLSALLGERITVVAPDGTVLADSAVDPAGLENHAARPEIVAARGGSTATVARRSVTFGEGALYVAALIPDTGGAVVRVSVPLDQVDAAVGRIQRDLAIAALAAALLVAAVGLVVAARIAQPLGALQRQAVRVAAGDLSGEVLPSATRELGDLGRAFNSMTRQLATSLAERDRARARLEAMLANLGDGVVVTDERGTVILLNRAAGGLLAHGGGDPAGQPFVQVARDHELWSLLRQALTAASGDDRARSATIEHGLSRRTIEATTKRLEGAGERLGLLLLRDVTELRRLEQVRREFVANVSHELRTPLASIKALVETLEAGAVDDPEVAGDFLHRIVGEVDRLAALVDDLLDLGRLESGRVALHLEPLAPRDLLQRALDRLRPQTERARLELRLDAAPDLPAVRADRARVEQILLNLVHNAIKFTPPGGTVTVVAAVEGDALRTTVRDTGVGVAPEELPRLFERFYKADKARRSEGTGLGLAIAKHIVQAHGGSIWAESTVGEGSAFTFSLPLADESPPPGGERSPGAFAAAGSVALPTDEAPAAARARR